MPFCWVSLPSSSSITNWRWRRAVLQPHCSVSKSFSRSLSKSYRGLSAQHKGASTNHLKCFILDDVSFSPVSKPLSIKTGLTKSTIWTNFSTMVKVIPWEEMTRATTGTCTSPRRTAPHLRERSTSRMTTKLSKYWWRSWTQNALVSLFAGLRHPQPLSWSQTKIRATTSATKWLKIQGLTKYM